MGNDRISRLIENVAHDITYVVREVAKRGFEEVEQERDDYKELRLRHEFKDLITGEIYESYFLPERHEFDWEIVHNIVEVMTSPTVVEFIGLSVAGGVVGNTAYDVLKTVLSWVVRTMKKVALPKSRYEPYEEIASDVEKIRQYFETCEAARINEVEMAISVPRERIYPFLRLLGFSHHRRKNNCLWCRPDS